MIMSSWHSDIRQEHWTRPGRDLCLCPRAPRGSLGDDAADTPCQEPQDHPPGGRDMIRRRIQEPRRLQRQSSEHPHVSSLSAGWILSDLKIILNHHGYFSSSIALKLTICILGYWWCYWFAVFFTFCLCWKYERVGECGPKCNVHSRHKDQSGH